MLTYLIDPASQSKEKTGQLLLESFREVVYKFVIESISKKFLDERTPKMVIQ